MWGAGVGRGRLALFYSHEAAVLRAGKSSTLMTGVRSFFFGDAFVFF
jgi:hypothetical protein